ncbi:MAG: helix-turn-helix domain-containing protein [Candidatus Zhuqueibacterota bacterium]
MAESTIRRYLRCYRNKGFDGFKPKSRSDSGTSHKIDGDTLEKAFLLKKEEPHRSSKKIIQLMEAHQWAPLGLLKPSTLSRIFKQHGLTFKQLKQSHKSFRAFQAEHPIKYGSRILCMDRICPILSDPPLKNEPIWWRSWMIFPDTTLKEMAVRQPKTWSELSSIVGMGQSKLKRYGLWFLKEILAYRQGQVALGHAASAAHAGSGRTELPTEQTTLRMLQQGLSPEQVAEERAISARTVYHHIETLILSGENLILDRFLPSDKHRVIRKVLHQLGVDDLDKVQARLGDGYSRHEIRLVRAKMIAEKRTRSNET